MNSSFPKSTTNVLRCNRLKPCLSKYPRKVQLVYDFSRISLIKVMDSLSPMNLEGTKQAAVEWLCFMSRVGREAQNDNIVLFCKFDGLWLVMGAVPIKEEEEWA